MNEFNLINDFFKVENKCPSVLMGIGDDCALLQAQKDKAIVVTVDSMVENVHFSSITPIHAIAQKLVVSNVSDIAANGATPKWATLSITLPHIDKQWLSAFSQALHSQLKHYGVVLVGGDTTRGKQIHLSMTLVGECQPGQYVRRKGAKSGDMICLGGRIGDAALGLMIEKSLQKNPNFISQSEYKQELQTLLNRFYYPQAQVSLGLLFKDYATAMIDISDGFLQDLHHIINQAKIDNSSLGYELTIDNTLFSKEYKKVFDFLLNNKKSKQAEKDGLEIDEDLEIALTSGEEYILCATIPPQALESQQFRQKIASIGMNIYPIGEITNTGKYSINGNIISSNNDKFSGYRHF